jgi:hypothetical protein
MKTLLSLLIGCSLALFLLAAGPARAAEREWKVGLARVKITPEQPVYLEGYAERNHPYERVAADLYAKAVVLEDGEGHRAALVTADLIGFSAAVAEPICERIRAKTGLRREQIVLSASHTHTGPRLGLDPKPREPMTAGDAQRTVAYTRWLQDRVVDVVVRAASRTEPCRLSWGTGVCSFVMNRREATPRGVILGVNPRGLVDRSVPVLRMDGGDGKPRAILFGYACHNTTLTGKDYEVCGDYAGFAQARVEERYPGAQAMFLTGCAGDANPHPRGTLALARRHGSELADEVCRTLEARLQPVRGPLQIAFKRAALPLQKAPSSEQLRKEAEKPGIHTWVAREMLAALKRGEKLPDHYTAPFAVWQLGQDLTLALLPGEVVVDYVPLLEQALGPLRLWPVAYCNDVFGYLPSARVLREGGYETRGLYAGGIGLFAPEAQDAVVEAVRGLATKAGRKLPSP